MDTLDKLSILADAAKYDAACTSSGVNRNAQKGSLGMASAAGCCHSFAPDGRCITLLKVLLSNACVYDCAYCVNRCSASCRRATFTPQELADLTVDFYKRNFIEGLFLSSGVLGTPDHTTELMIECLHILRSKLRFRGYIHAKIIPGTSPELIDAIGRLADRLSVNLELPSSQSLKLLCPNKNTQSVMEPMKLIYQKRCAEDSIYVEEQTNLKAVNIKTAPYPGFATDLQQPITPLLLKAEGRGTLIDTIYEKRVNHVFELAKMNADISTTNDHIFYKGGNPLQGASVRATDLRAGAALVIAGLMAEGRTEITSVEFILRGYSNIIEKLRNLGADIELIKD